MVVTKKAVGQMMDGAPQGLNTLIHSLVQIIRTAGQDLAEARYQLMESKGEGSSTVCEAALLPVARADI